MFPTLPRLYDIKRRHLHLQGWGEPKKRDSTHVSRKHVDKRGIRVREEISPPSFETNFHLLNLDYNDSIAPESMMTTHYESGTLTALLTTAISTVIVYVVYQALYNLYFHPLARFPGPPLARVTIYWKGYVECIANQSFCHVLVGLHAQYGEAFIPTQLRVLTSVG